MCVYTYMYNVWCVYVSMNVYTVYAHRYCVSVILYFVATSKRYFGSLLLNKLNESVPRYVSFPVLCSLHWLNITEDTKSIPTITEPPLSSSSVHRPRITHSSSVVTLARLPTSSLQFITDRSFRYQLRLSLRQPHSGTSFSISDLSASITFFSTSSSSSDSPLCSSVTSLLLHFIKTYLFH